MMDERGEEERGDGGPERRRESKREGHGSVLGASA